MIDRYDFYFQYTLNNYHKILEPNLPSYTKRLDIFKKLSDIIPPHRVILRYDPIVLSNKTDYTFHLKGIEQTLSILKDYVDTLMVSFITPYRKIHKRLNGLEKEHGFIMQTPDSEDVNSFASNLSSVGELFKVKISSCSDSRFDDTKIERGCCIDGDLVNKIKGTSINFKKDSNQRDGCGCVKSVDMGSYNTCSFNCAYCYANHNSSVVSKNLKRYDPLNSSLLS